MDSPRVRLAVRAIHKSYAVPVLTAVDLDLRAGEVHALVGANGAGKSTLTRILSGLSRADAGAMTLEGVTYAPASRRDAERAGVLLVPQDPPTVGTLTVAEQIFLADLPQRIGVIDRRRLETRAATALARVGLDDLDPQAPVATLGVGHRHLLAVAAALARECRVLILDEPTAALAHVEATRLLAQVGALREAGLAILYISHRLGEILTLADRVTVLRDGRVVDARPIADATVDGLVRAMVPGAGQARRRPTPGAASHDAAPREAPVALRVDRISRGTVVEDVSLEVRAGEIVGLYGLVGAGRTELLRAIYGADRRDAGHVRRNEGPALVIESPADAVRAGIGLVPEDRLADALLAPESIRHNVSLASLRRLSWWRWLVDARRETSAVAAAVDALDVRRQSLDQEVGRLSGGNQQKVVVARWLLRECQVLLVDEPSRGVDVSATQAIHDELRRLAAQGRALLVASSDLEELVSLADRIVVMARGRVSATFTRGAWRLAEMQAAAFASGAAVTRGSRPA